MAYDPATSTVVLFGGQNSSSIALGDTWTWDGTTWTQQSPATSPAARLDSSMAYDAATGTVVLFGGHDNNGNFFNDTWTWNGTTWTQQSPVTSPALRFNTSMAYDAATGTVVLFGGTDSSGNFFNDTWTWNGTTWAQQSPATSPAGRLGPSMAYDAATGTVVLTGGLNLSTTFNDTWTWNGTTWSQQSPVTSAPTQAQSPAAYDSATGTVVLFAFNSTWTWNGTTWTQQSPVTSPPGRSLSTMAYDAATGTLVLFGGDSVPPVILSDTWTLYSNPFNAGSSPVGTPIASFPVLFTFETSGSLGSLPTVLTQGAIGLDFTDANTGTCTTNGTSHPYNAGDTCTVNVIFKPKYPGEGMGAVQLTGSGGTVIATALVYGIGTGPQVIFGSNIQSTLGGGFNGPTGVAVDANGNVYVADAVNNLVKEIPAGCTTATCVTTLGGGFSKPTGVAVDAGDNVFVADYSNSLVKEIPAGCTTATCVSTLGDGFNNPNGIAVDGSGDVFVADYSNNLVKEIPAGCTSSTCVSALGGGFNQPTGVAVDASGNVFVADYNNSLVKEIPVGCTSSTCVSTLGGGFNQPTGVAVDAGGNVFVAGNNSNVVMEIPVGCTTSTCVSTLGGIFSNPYGVALDASGDVFVADSVSNAVTKLDFVDAPALNFASTLIGSTSSDSPQLVTIANDGNAPLTVSSIAASNSNFTIIGASDGTAPACGSTLTAGASCGLAVSFKPTTTGPLTGTANIIDNSLNATAPTYATQSIATSGIGLNNAVLLLSPNPITFSNQPVGSISNSWTATLSNESGIAAPLAGITIAGANPTEFSETNNCGTSVPAYSTCNILVTFNPTAATSFTGTLVVTAYTTDSPLSSTLTGTGTSNSPTVTVSPGSIGFSNQMQGATGNPWTVTLSNTSGYPLTITSIALNDTTDFTLVNNCGGTLAAYSTCTLQVSFSPQSATAFNGMLTFTDNASTGNGVQTVTLSGTGTSSTPVLVVSPMTVTFGNQPAGTASNPWTVNISNTSSTPATPLNLFMAAPPDFTYTTNCGSTLAAYSSCTVLISFKPNETIISPFPESGQFFVTNNNGTPQIVNLTGTATPGVPTVQVSATNINFGNQLIGTPSSPWTVTVSNTSNVVATLDIVNGFPPDFSDTTTCGTTLAAYSTCIIQLTFTPTLVLGEIGQLIVEVPNEFGAVPFIVQLSGTGVAPQPLFFSPGAINFGNQTVSTSNTWTATLNNPSGQPVQLFLPPAGTLGLGFSQTNNCPNTLPAYSNCNFQITFAPTFTTGAYSGTLLISALYTINGLPYNSGVLSLLLTGTGVAISQAVFFSTGNINFGNQTIGTTSNPWTITLNNTGNGAVTLSPAIFLSDTTDFTQTNNCPASLPAFTNCNILVSFTPTVSGSIPGTLSVGVDGTPLSVTLTGNGSVAPDYALSVNPATLTLASGQTGQATFTFTPVGGFTGTATFACTGLPAGSSCSFQPASLTANGSNTAQTSTLTVTTIGPSSGMAAINMNRMGFTPVLASIFLLPGLALGGLLAWRRRMLSARLRSLLFLLLLALTIGGGVGCGSFANATSVTPPGTSVVTVVGSASATATASKGSVTHTASFTLIVKEQ